MKRKILSFALVLMMAISLVAPLMTLQVSAANFTPDPQPITIHGSESVDIIGETFQVYKIFDLYSWDAGSSIDDERFAYRINPAFEGFDTAAFVNSYFTSVPSELQGDVSLKDVLEYFRGDTPYADIASDDVLAINDDTWAVPLTNMLIQYIEQNNIPATDYTADDDPYTINLPDLGYYIIRTLGYNPTSTNDEGRSDSDRVTAIAALRTNEVAVTIHCKADAPTIDKDVWDAKGDSWEGYTDANIGDTVWFKLTSKVPNMRGYDKYYMTMYDLLSSGLTFNNDIKVYIADPNLGLTAMSPTDIAASGAINITPYYAGSYAGAITGDPYNIVIEFGDIKGWYANDYTGYDIIVIYSAVLNDDAVVTNDPADDTQNGGNPNKVWLEYSNNPYDTQNSKGKTREKHVTVFTFEIDIEKYFTANGNNAPLAAAVFNLYKAEGFAWDDGKATGTPLNFKDLTDGKYKHTTGTGDPDLISPASGLIDIIGLEKGEYYLVEIDAPKGYNLLEAPIKVTIDYDANGNKFASWKLDTLDKTYLNDEDYIYGEIEGTLEPGDRIEIENRSGIKFPETGGIGTIIFYVIGGLLTVGTGFLLIVRSQVSKKKEQADKAKQQKAAV